MASEADSTLGAGETWHGGCHCGAHAFTVNLQEPLYEQAVSSCNCSICHLNGYFFIYPANKDVTWTSGGPPSPEGPPQPATTPELTPYRFAQARVAHYFCSRCGTSLCGKGATPDFFPNNTALNVRAFKDVDLDKLKINKVDGKSL